MANEWSTMRNTESQVHVARAAWVCAVMLCACSEAPVEKAADSDASSAAKTVPEAAFDPDNCNSGKSVVIDAGAFADGSAWCVIDGDLYITHESPKTAITDDTLEQLRHITTVKGSVYVSGTDAHALLGLRNLTSIGADLVIDDNDELQSLVGLEKLATIGHDLVVRGNIRLTDFAALKKLTTVTNGLLIEDNQSLQKIDGLKQISAVAHSVTIRSNTKLKHLNGLAALTDAGKVGVTIAKNNQLQHTVGLSKLESAGKLLLLQDNAQLAKLGTFANISKVDHVHIINNDQLARIDGFNKLAEIKTAKFESNAAVDQFAGFAQLKSADEIRLVGHKSMQQMLGFANLTQAVSLELRNNHTLTELKFNKLHQVVELTVRDNAALSNYGGFLALKYVKTLTLCGNPKLSESETTDFIKSLYSPPQKIVQVCK